MKRFIALIVCAFMAFQAPAFSAGYNKSEWSHYNNVLVKNVFSSWPYNDTFGGNCFAFARLVTYTNTNGKVDFISNNSAGRREIVGMGGYKIAQHLNESGILDSGGIQSVFSNTQPGDVVQMVWHNGYWTQHTFIIAGVDGGGINVLQSNVGSQTITNKYYRWSDLAGLYSNAGSSGGFTIYRFSGVISAPKPEDPTPINPTPEDPTQTIEITTDSNLGGTTKDTYFDKYLECTGDGSGYWEHTGGTFPNGLELNHNNGHLHGYIHETGTFTFTLHVRNNSGEGSKQFTLTVNEPQNEPENPNPPEEPRHLIEITNPSGSELPADNKGADYDFPFICTGSGNTQWEKSSGSFPPDLRLDEHSGRLWGKLTQDGKYTFTIIARNDSGVCEKTFTLEIRNPNAPVITNPEGDSLPRDKKGNGYDFTFRCTGNGNTKWEKSSGSFPPELQFNELSGHLSGKLTQSGTFRFKLIARNDSGATEREFTMTVRDPDAATIKTNSELQGTRDSDYDLTFSASGSGNIRWEITGGTLPPNMTLDGARLHGRPSESGIYKFTLRAWNDLGDDTRTFTLTVNEPVRDPLAFAGEMPYDATAGQPYSGRITVSGGASPYVWESAGDLPGGLSFTFSGNEAVLSGIPNREGTYSFGLKVTDDDKKILTENYVVQVTRAELIGAIPSGTRRGKYSGVLATVGGTKPYSYSVVKGKLPDGLELDENSGEIKGTLSKAGTFSFTVAVRDKNGIESEKEYTVKVTQTTLTGDIPVSTTRKAKYTGTPKVSGGSGAYTFSISAGKLPEGVIINSKTGKITGTPSKAGTYKFTVKAKDSNGAASTKSYTVKVTQTTLTGDIPTTTTRRAKYTGTPKVSGGSGTYTFSISAGKLPDGVIINIKTGKISGTPSKAGTFKFTVKAKDSNGAASTKDYTVKVTQTTLTGDIPASTTRKAKYTGAPKVSGGSGTYTFSISAGKLPDGVTIDSKTGKISGTPSKAGTFKFTVKAKDSNGAASTKDYTVKVTQTTLTGDIPASTTRKAKYTGAPKVSGGSGTYTFSISAGKLPEGVIINTKTGKISGTPSKAGTFKFTVKAKDSNGAASTKDYTVKVTQTTLTGDIPTSTTRKAKYTGTPKVSGGSGTYTFSISAGKLPDGVTINTKTGKISGTPSKAGTFKFTVKAKDSNTVASIKEYTITVTETKVTGTLPNGKKGNSYSATLKASGGASPYKWTVSAGKLPDNTNIDASTGKISGKPSKAGTYKFTIKAKDKNGAASTKSFTVKISQADSSSLPADKSDIPENVSDTKSAASLTGYATTFPENYGHEDRTPAIFRTSLNVMSDDIVAEIDAGIIDVHAGKPLRLIIGEWVYNDGSKAEVSDLCVWLNFEASEDVAISDEGTFTIPAEEVDGGFCVSVKAKAGSIELETEELHITAE